MATYKSQRELLQLGTMEEFWPRHELCMNPSLVNQTVNRDTRLGAPREFSMSMPNTKNTLEFAIGAIALH